MVSVETAPSGTSTAMPLPATAVTAGFNSATVVLGFHFGPLQSVGRLSNDHAIVKLHHGLQVSEEQEGAQIDLHADHVARQFGESQHFYTVQLARLVGGNVPPMHPGIDRYLNSAPGSRGMLQQIDRRPSPLTLNMFRRPLAKHNFHNVAPGNSIQRLMLAASFRPAAAR